VIIICPFWGDFIHLDDARRYWLALTLAAQAKQFAVAYDRINTPGVTMKQSLSALPSPAAVAQPGAASYLITYKGHVSNSYDQTGAFGVEPGRSLDGLAFAAVYTLTYPTPDAYADYDDGTVAQTYGGSAYGTPSPVSALLTINGASMEFSGNYIGAMKKLNNYHEYGNYYNDYIYSMVNDKYGEYDRHIVNYLYSLTGDIFKLSDLREPFSHVHDPVVGGSHGCFESVVCDSNSGDPLRTYGDLNAESVSVAVAGAAPEPTNWARMLLGLGSRKQGSLSRRMSAGPIGGAAQGAAIGDLMCSAAKDPA